MADEKQETAKCAECGDVVPKTALKGAVDGRLLCAAKCWERGKGEHKIGSGARRREA